jgi:flavodoxin/NAD-dependent dihydropyrimidine dehydrogenase PreA subunit
MTLYMALEVVFDYHGEDCGRYAMNPVIFYFSGTGNTRYVARSIATCLDGPPIVRSIESITPAEADGLIEEASLVGIGYPIYASDLPQPMKDFLLALGPHPGKHVFVFCTQWMYSGDGARAATRYLRHSGFSIRFAEHFRMPDDISVSAIRFPYTNDPARIRRVLSRADARADIFARRIRGAPARSVLHLLRPRRRGFNPLSRFLGWFQRVPFRATFDRWRDDISVDLDRCTRCGLCTRLCPSGNMTFDAASDSFPTRGTCVICMRCYDFCPVAAVVYLKKPHDLRRGDPYRGPEPTTLADLLADGARCRRRYVP